MVKQVKRYLKTFEDLLEYNQKLTDKVRWKYTFIILGGIKNELH
jgi:hypothetical protein